MMQNPRPSRELPLTGRRVDVERSNEEREAEISRLVDHFYALGRTDPLLGPVFESRVSDWGKHLKTMRDFWSSAVYRTGRYHGRPLEVHRRIAEIGPEHYAKWLELWERAVGETVRSGARTALIELARRMADTMSPRTR